MDLVKQEVTRLSVAINVLKEYRVTVEFTVALMYNYYPCQIWATFPMATLRV